VRARVAGQHEQRVAGHERHRIDEALEVLVRPAGRDAEHQRPAAQPVARAQLVLRRGRDPIASRAQGDDVDLGRIGVQVSHELVLDMGRDGDDAVGRAGGQRDEHAHAVGQQARMGVGDGLVDQVEDRHHARRARVQDGRGRRRRVHDLRPAAPCGQRHQRLLGQHAPNAGARRDPDAQDARARHPRRVAPLGGEFG